MKNKIEKIAKIIISYIGAIGLGMFIAVGIECVFDKWIGAGIIVATLLMVTAFIGGEECIPEDEKGE